MSCAMRSGREQEGGGEALLKIGCSVISPGVLRWAYTRCSSRTNARDPLLARMK